MKTHHLLFLALGISGSTLSNAQTAFTTMDSIDINKLNATALVHGDIWMDFTPATAPYGDYGCFFPNGTRKHLAIAGGLWLSGYDPGNNLHISAAMYREPGNDYWPGPITSDTTTYATSTKWAKIWKVTRYQVQYFQSLADLTPATVPADILTWPGRGNTYASGAGSAPLTVDSAMAPFVDLNMDGIYEPLEGEYPDFHGDEVLWWVFSDKGATHNETNGKPLGVEVHAMAYAYNRGTDIDNVVYYNYKIINKSTTTYNNFRTAQFADLDLGQYNDDYIGIDTTRALGIIYNSTGSDGGGASLPVPVGDYGDTIPVAGVTLFGQCASFTYFNNDFTIIGNPSADTEFNNYMRSRIRNGQHITNDFTAPGTPSYAYNPGPDVNYVYTGDPSVDTQWSECAAANAAGDRRFVISSNDATLYPGGTADFNLALVTTDPSVNNGCPHVSFDSIKSIRDLAATIFDSPLPPPPAAVTNIVGSKGSINIYPVPAHNMVNVALTGSVHGNGTITIYNTIGQPMLLQSVSGAGICKIDISTLPPGIYTVYYNSADGTSVSKLVKE